MDLREIESTLPPGFRFHPSDEELVCHYLYKKVTNERIAQGTLVEVDLHAREPWELPEVAKLSDNEWYFFSFRDRKYATGCRTNRATKSGYWKATGKDRSVYHQEPTAAAAAAAAVLVGMRKTLVFYRGRAPDGIKTRWIMHEFRLHNPNLRMPPKGDWVLCRVFHKTKGETVRYGQGSEQCNVGSSSPNLKSSSPPPPSMMDRGVTDVYEQEPADPYAYHVPHHREEASGRNSLLDVAAVWRYDFPQATAPIATDGDGYGLPLELGCLGGHDMGDVEMGTLEEEMRFHEDAMMDTVCNLQF